MSLDNIPHEMRGYRQWILWRYDTDDRGKPTKLPYSPIYKGRLASVDKPDGWGDFETVYNLFHQNPNLFSGIGFVLTKNDPYCFIDLDDSDHNNEIFERQLKVLANFNTYAELSPSGKGLHLICKGQVPSGRKRSKIEIYSDGRYMTMTGKLYNGTQTPIEDCSDMTLTLWGQMGKNDPRGFYDPNAPETETDAQVIDRASNASNGTLFLDLMAGRFQEYPQYPSQSEADQALINIIAYYTQNKTQIARIFRSSALGQRDKAKRRDYMDYTTNKAFDQIAPPVDVEGMAEIAKMFLEQRKAPQTGAEPINGASQGLGNGIATEVSNPLPIDITTETYAARGEEIPLHLKRTPNGLLGEIIQFIYDQSPRHVPEAAIAGAIGFMAGMIGRCYNINGSGLNQYVLFLAPSGAGKESITQGIDKMLAVVRQQVPLIDEFYGPGDIASGQAITKQLNETPCFVSIIGEFDNMLKMMSSQYANAGLIMLKKTILGLYQQSGQGRVSRKMVYADKEKNTTNVKSPAFSLLTECTPQLLFDQVSDDLITSGLLPRFLVIEYKGKINHVDKNAFTVMPSKYLTDRIAELADHCFKLNAADKVTDVEMTPDADDMLEAFSRFCTDKINEYREHSVMSFMWNRVHLKVLKLAATLAVGINPYRPVIDMQSAEYAKSLVMHDMLNIIDRYETGAMGAKTDETEQSTEIRNCIRKFLTTQFDPKMHGYGVTKKMHDYKCIPKTYFSRMLPQRAAFRKDKLSSQLALNRAIKQMIDEGILQELPKNQVAEIFEGKTCIMYTILDPKHVLGYH